ncbi:MAG TPA: polysaccharide deacetylase family protein [Candidatus Acidoferrales bacterium]|jgi:peptidoglycan/xylan/chitin deacetylase (PgdA/CDA1 family)|nr:polysaccharide deacetylase family protein [Candidatus Acidoferrales bacterium]
MLLKTRYPGREPRASAGAGAGAFHRVLKRFGGGFILAFHEVPPARFIELVEVLSAFRPVPLSELVERMKAGKRTDGLFAITVDDGVGENVRALAGVLRAKGWPGTFYLPTGYLDSGCGMPFQWWRNIAPLLPRGPIRLGNETVDLSDGRAKQRLSRRMEVSLHTQPLDSYLPLIMQLTDMVCCQRGLTRKQLEPPAAIAAAEIRDICRGGLIRFESHGVSHAAVSAMTPEEIAAEMKNSQDRVAELSGQPCRHFCYPFGSPESIGRIAPAIARQFYDSAVTMSLGDVDRADPWLLPRIPLYAENSSTRARLKIVLKCCRLGINRDSAAEAGERYKSTHV